MSEHLINDINQTRKRTNKRFSSITLASMLAVCLLLTSCMAKNTTPKRYEQVFFDVFDTVTTVALYDTSEASAEARIQKTHDLLLMYHKLYDIYHAYDGINNLYTVNQNAGIAPVAVDTRILDLIAFSKDMYALTNGKMNIAMGGVLSIWSDYRQAGLNDLDHAALPPMEALLSANEHASIDSIVTDRENGTLYISNENTRLDVGAVAKGYAAQQVVEQMKSEGATTMLLSVGGNVCSIGMRADGLDWKVGIQDPYSSDMLWAVRVNDRCLVTSGTYERYYTVDGKRYHHVIDPETLMPSTYFDSVSVICVDSGLADALTTGLFCMPLSEGLTLVESLDGVEAMWVETDTTQTQSSGFGAFTQAG